SRSQHTRSKRDWSSDVCSSDLKNAHSARKIPAAPMPPAMHRHTRVVQAKTVRNRLTPRKLRKKNSAKATTTTASEIATLAFIGRSEERRVGKNNKNRRVKMLA